MLTINQKIPDLALKIYHDDEIKDGNLADYRGKWLLVIFYPGDFTFICPTELEEAAEHYDQFQKMGVEVLSVSTDSAHTHKAWHDVSPAVSKVRFPMVSDMTAKMCKEFGTYIEAEGKSLRGTFIIDPDGILKSYELNDNDIGRSIKETVRKIQAAKFVKEHPGLVCPASWEPGDETLKPGLDLVGKI